MLELNVWFTFTEIFKWRNSYYYAWCFWLTKYYVFNCVGRTPIGKLNKVVKIHSLQCNIYCRLLVLLKKMFNSAKWYIHIGYVQYIAVYQSGDFIHRSRKFYSHVLETCIIDKEHKWKSTFCTRSCLENSNVTCVGHKLKLWGKNIADCWFSITHAWKYLVCYNI